MLDSLENAKRKQEAERELLQLEARSTQIRLALIALIRGKTNLELIFNHGVFTGFTKMVKVPEYIEYIVRLFVGVCHTTGLNDTSQNDPKDKTLTSIGNDRDIGIVFEVFNANDTELTAPITTEGYRLMSYHVIHPIDSIDGRLAFGLTKRYDDKTVTVSPHEKQAFIAKLAKFEEALDLLQR